MSINNILKFCKVSKEDRNLNLKLEDLLSELDNKSVSYDDILKVANEIVLLAKDYDLSFTTNELFDYLEFKSRHLTDDELICVAGGISRKAAGVGLSAIAILSLGTGALSFFSRNDNNKVAKERNTATLKSFKDEDSDEKDNEDLYNDINENKKFKGGKNNWRELLKNFNTTKKNNDQTKVPSFAREIPKNFETNKVANLKKSLPKIYLNPQEKTNLNFEQTNGNQYDNMQATNKNQQANSQVNNGSHQANIQVTNKNDSNTSKNSLPNIKNDISNNNNNNISQDDNQTKKTSKKSFLQRGTLETFCGIKKVENICYLNSVLQQLYHNNSIRKAVLSANTDEKMIHTNALKNIFKKMFNEDVDENSLKEFIKEFKNIYNGNQQDSSEIYKIIFSELEKEGLNLKETKVITEEMISSEDNSKETKWKKSDNHGCSSISINVNKDKKSLNSYFDENGVYDISEIDDYKFDGNNVVTKAKKYTRISSFPNNLVIDLNRYGYNKSIKEQYKVNVSLLISENINIKNNDYRLKTVTVHIGGVNNGHYYVYVRNGETFLKINDDIVQEVSFEEIQDEISKNATMVTYEKIN